MSDQQSLPGIVRTADEVHAANNAVIAGAKALAAEHLLTMVIVVGAPIIDAHARRRTTTYLIGVDCSPGEAHEHIQLAAMAYGAVQAAAQTGHERLGKQAVELGWKNSALLFERGAAHVGRQAERCGAILAAILDMGVQGDFDCRPPVDNGSLALYLNLLHKREELATDLQALVDAGILTREGGVYELRPGFQDDMVAAGIRALVEKAVGVR